MGRRTDRAQWRTGCHITSAAHGHTVGRTVALGYVHNQGGLVDAAFVTGGRYQIDVAGELFGATAQLRAAYDPDGQRVRC